jgi:hypothetical protein
VFRIEFKYKANILHWLRLIRNEGLQRGEPGLFLDGEDVDPTPGYGCPLVDSRDAEMPPPPCSADEAMAWLPQAELAPSRPAFRLHCPLLFRLRLRQVRRRLLPFEFHLALLRVATRSLLSVRQAATYILSHTFDDANPLLLAAALLLRDAPV